MAYVGFSLHLVGYHLALFRRKIYGKMQNFPLVFSKFTCFRTGNPRERKLGEGNKNVESSQRWAWVRELPNQVLKLMLLLSLKRSLDSN